MNHLLELLEEQWKGSFEVKTLLTVKEGFDYVKNSPAYAIIDLGTR